MYISCYISILMLGVGARSAFVLTSGIKPDLQRQTVDFDPSSKLQIVIERPVSGITDSTITIHSLHRRVAPAQSPLTRLQGEVNTIANNFYNKYKDISVPKGVTSAKTATRLELSREVSIEYHNEFVNLLETCVELEASGDIQARDVPGVLRIFEEKYSSLISKTGLEEWTFSGGTADHNPPPPPQIRDRKSAGRKPVEGGERLTALGKPVTVLDDRAQEIHRLGSGLRTMIRPGSYRDDGEAGPAMLRETVTGLKHITKNFKGSSPGPL